MSWKNTIANWLERSGAGALLGALPKRNVLMVFNYHRIGNPRSTLYDPDVFSATAAGLEAQVAFLKKRLPLIGLAEALEIAGGKRKLTGAAGLITFDDGYRDNFDLAFPILRSHGAPAVFFLVSSYVGSSYVPWWDEIAYLAKHSKKDTVRLQYPHELIFENVRADPGVLAGKVTALYKQPDVDGERLLESLAEACQTERPGQSAERLFLDWDEARAMLRGGMDIASHTHTHRILSKLTPEEQYSEAFESKRILDSQLCIRVAAMAYPVGLRSSFSAETGQALERAGYRAAFSFYGGLNSDQIMSAFDIRRCAVDPRSAELFRLRTALTSLTGKSCFYPR
ncbi:MAG TPA: polysaccharide deacetylase family protein [Bryobacteraceae bacterium]